MRAADPEPGSRASSPPGSPPGPESGSEPASALSPGSAGGPGPGPRRVVPGIVYLGHIPPRFQPRHVRSLLGGHGELGRVFFRPEDRLGQRNKRRAASGSRRRRRGRGPAYSEGWVEFRDKRAAKLVAASLHNSPLGGPFRHDLWNLKYLHRFQWSHLSERLAQEGRARLQRLRAEILQAKRDSDCYLRRAERAAGGGASAPRRGWDFVQRATEPEMRARRGGQEQPLHARPKEPWLARIFRPGA